MLKEARADHEPAAWQDEIFEALRVAGVRQVAYVPDAIATWHFPLFSSDRLLLGAGARISRSE